MVIGTGDWGASVCPDSPRPRQNPPCSYPDRVGDDLDIGGVLHDPPDGTGQVHRRAQAFGHPVRQFGCSAVHEVGFRPPGVRVVAEPTAATRQDEGAQQRDFRRVGAEQQIHRRFEEGAGGARGHVEGTGEPLPERLGIPRPCAPGPPGGVRGKPSRHQVQAQESQPESGERGRAGLGDAAPVAVVDPVETHDVVAVVVLRVHLQPVFPAELEHPLLALSQPRPARRDHGAAGQLPVPDPAAHAVPGLEHHDLTPRSGQLPRGGKPRESGAHDTHVRCHLLHDPPPRSSLARRGRRRPVGDPAGRDRRAVRVTQSGRAGEVSATLEGGSAREALG